MPLSFDWQTAIITLVIAPIVYYALRRITRFLRAHLAHLLDATFWALGRFFSARLAQRMSLRRYCRLGLARADAKYLHVPGRGGLAIETDEIFVPLRLDDRTFSEVTTGMGLLSDDSPRCRIVGDPGSGKSSLVKRLFRDACHAGSSGVGHYTFRDGKVVKIPARLPILVELKTLAPPSEAATAEDLANWLLKLLKTQVEGVEGFEMGRLLESQTRGNGLLVLLDGLDEVSGENYDKVSLAICGLGDKLASLSPSNAVVLTMREQFHTQVAAEFADSLPVVYYIQPFTPSDIFSFLERWPFREREREQRTRIYSDLTDRPTLREMCSNPLVLAMYVASDQTADDPGAPETRTEFYSRVVEELLVTRRSRQIGLQARSALRLQREAVLGPVAYAHLLDANEAANTLSWEAAVRQAQLVFKCDEHAAAARVRALAKETGLITEEREGESFRFIHLTFCEYLAAREASLGRRDGWQELCAAHEKFVASDKPQVRTRLIEVLPFAAGLLPRANRHDATTALGRLRDARVLGRSFLETQAYDHPVWDQYAKAEAEALLGESQENWDGEWLRRLHLFNVVLKDYERWSSVYGFRSNIRLEGIFKRLVGSDRGRLVRLFSTYAQVDAAAALRLADDVGVDMVKEEPALVARNLQSAPFFAIALQQLLDQPARLDVFVPVFAEAGLSYSAVARELAAISPPVHVEAAVARVPRNRRWFLGQRRHRDRGGVGGFMEARMERSLYTYILTLAVNQDRDVADLERVQELRAVRPPSGTVPAAVFQVLGAGVLVGGMLVVSTCVPVDWLSAHFAVCLGVLLSVAVLTPGLLLYGRARRALYAAAANFEGYLVWALALRATAFSRIRQIVRGTWVPQIVSPGLRRMVDMRGQQGLTVEMVASEEQSA